LRLSRISADQRVKARFARVYVSLAGISEV
jgi:hypothetical protein